MARYGEGSDEAKDLGVAIKELRTHKGLSQTGVAKACGVVPAYISLIESGKRTLTLETLAAIVDTLEGTLSVTIGEHAETRVRASDDRRELERALQRAEEAERRQRVAEERLATLRQQLAGLVRLSGGE